VTRITSSDSSKSDEKNGRQLQMERSVTASDILSGHQSRLAFNGSGVFTIQTDDNHSGGREV